MARYIHNIPILRSLQRKIRKKRAGLFARLMQPQSAWKILDVGGTYPTWEQPGMESFQVTLLNLGASILPAHLEGRVISVAGDATSLPYENRSFDLIYSNSVIEHVGSIENQKKFATEALRVGRALWIQTPAQGFLFEPHYMAFFIHWFPRSWQPRMLRWGSLWGVLNKPTGAQCDDYVRYNQLLTHKEVQRLFPGCRIIKERFFGLTKSYIVVKSYSSSAGATEIEAR
jgi:hypothetical protein